MRYLVRIDTITDWDRSEDDAGGCTRAP